MLYAIGIFVFILLSTLLGLGDVNAKEYNLVQEYVEFGEYDYICLDCGERKDGEPYCTGSCSDLEVLLDKEEEVLLNEVNI